MNKRQRTNLLKLANFLKKVPDSHFNLEYFVENMKRREQSIWSAWNWDETHKNLKKAAETGKDLHCGAVGCAIGFCPVVFPHSFKYHNNHVRLRRSSWTSDFETASRFFGLSYRETRYLFMPKRNYKSKERVIARIKEFCKTQIVPKGYIDG